MEAPLETTEPAKAEPLLKAFRGMRWMFWCWLAVWFSLFAGANACGETRWGQWAAIATVCCALWASHVRAVQAGGARIVLRVLAGAAYNLLILAVATILLSLPFIVLMPAYSCYNARSKVLELMLAGSPYKSTIAERVAEGKATSLEGIGTGLTIPNTGRVAGGLVGSNGFIALASADPPAVITLTPALKDGKVTWTCRGHPGDLMPKSCLPPGKAER
jgi:hypothetical protein